MTGSSVEHHINFISTIRIIKLIFAIHNIPDEVLITEFGILYI
jgi:hypothetical protein